MQLALGLKSTGYADDERGKDIGNQGAGPQSFIIQGRPLIEEKSTQGTKASSQKDNPIIHCRKFVIIGFFSTNQ